MQYPVILCRFFLHLDSFNSFNHYRASLVYTQRKEERKKESQEIDDLPVLVTCRSGTSAMLSSEVNGPTAQRSTR